MRTQITAVDFRYETTVSRNRRLIHNGTATFLARYASIMDPLSRVLELVTVESAVSTRLEAGGRWALSFPGVRHIKLAAIHRGEAWLRVGTDTEQRLRAGDCFVLTSTDGYAVASEPGLEPVDGLPAFRATTDGVVRLGRADEVVMTGARFVLDAGSSRLLLDVLPDLLIIAADQESSAALHWALDLFAHETATPRLGSALVTARLAQVVFVEALRAATIADDTRISGWLAALTDERIGPALHLMHTDPTRRWTIPALADTVHMSRSGFTDRFRTIVGTSPLDHLLRVRMHIAGRELRHTNTTVSSIGAAAGYTSDAAFSNAFKRVMGSSPSAWRANQDPTTSAPDETDAAAGAALVAANG
jgi:AraC-like DNA-binding protein